MRHRERAHIQNGPLPSRIGAAAAEHLLGISRTALLVLAKRGRLPGRILDRQGMRRHWEFKLSDVLRLKQSKQVLKYHKEHRIRKREEWKKHFGDIPNGCTVACRDGNEANLDATNLCLLPLKIRRKLPHEVVKHQRRPGSRTSWSADKLRYLKKSFPHTPSEEIAVRLGCSVAAVRGYARRLKLRKSIECIRAQARASNRLPLGTERVKEHTNIVWVKVSQDGPQYAQWRPKHHLIWEQATGQKVLPRHCVIFRDGNKRNFSVENLEALSKRENAARGFARFFSYPESLRKAIKLNARLGREIRRRSENVESETPARAPRQTARAKPRRWTDQMDQVLYRDYPVKPIAQILKTLGVSESSLRQRVRRLNIRRLPETIIAEARTASLMAIAEKRYATKKAHN